MKQVAIIVPRGAVALSCIEGPLVCFSKVNDFLAQAGQSPLFHVKLMGTSLEPVVYHHFFKVTPDVQLSDDYKPDLIVIPAVNGEWNEVVKSNEPFLKWIADQRNQNGAEVASLCVGAFLLAGTGLLAGKRCATHWGAVGDFNKMFPEVELVSERIIIDENGIYSSGGANSFWNLLIYLVEKYVSRDMAIVLSKYFEIEIDRDNQATFSIFKGQRTHQDESVLLAQDFIESNWGEKITVEQLAEKFAVGRRSLERRFKKATSNTVTEYIQRVKMEAAKKSFETSLKNINEIMYEVGYSDTKAFRNIFKKNTGLSPMEYRNRFNKTELK
ncbi:helix-turn-helix domain-containing protein [Chitinophaga silvatica]|uniref:Helix-turn-helix domain-containing protein n=1 Tax=Chitinophaga silvatica TaxID=2282649 RepID=A0A3E1YG35_9BACT|nr:helix-turn-helix domain-containing protein [Chitinophaga silvatica]RFS26344.1 helix-turn-helix domain-containing protein [Chitinophaga silvatica]